MELIIQNYVTKANLNQNIFRNAELFFFFSYQQQSDFITSQQSRDNRNTKYGTAVYKYVCILYSVGGLMLLLLLLLLCVVMLMINPKPTKSAFDIRNFLLN